MTAAAILAEARSNGVKVTLEGDQIGLDGAITNELIHLFREHKTEILALLKRPALFSTPSTTASSTTTRPLAPMGWGYDWKGTLVDLSGLRPGEDGKAPIFVSAKPEGLQ